MKQIMTRYDLSKLAPEQTRNFQSLPLFWKRELVKQRCAGRCELCGLGKGRDLHHKTYKRKGKELPEDLALVCRCCHEALHHIEEGWIGKSVHHGKDVTWPKNDEDRAAVIKDSKERRAALIKAKAAEIYWHNKANGIQVLQGVCYEGF